MNGPIALTGATGFVGRRVLALCAESGVAVRALARRPADLDAARTRSLEIVEGDILDDGALDALAAGAAAIIHCAGAIAAHAPDTFASVNVEGTRRLAAAARRAGTARFVHVSSLAAREPGLSAYGLSKRLGEREVMDGMARENWVIVRPPVVYGPGDRATLPLIDQFTRQAAWLPGSRRQRFSLIYVDDLARALVALARSRGPCGTIHELHDGRADGYSWENVAAAALASEGRPRRVHYLPRVVVGAVSHLAQGWTRATGRRLGTPLSPGKVRELYHRDWVCRNGPLDEETGWSAKVGLEEGLALSLDWYRRNGWLPHPSGVTKTPAGTDHGVRPG